MPVTLPTVRTNSPVPFICPHCGAKQFVAFGNGLASDDTYRDVRVSSFLLDVKMNSNPCIGTRTTVAICAMCHKPTIRLNVVLKEAGYLGPPRVDGRTLQQYFNGQIYPAASTPAIHSSVPGSLAEDYREAHAILNLSPKASAVLARRVVQGAIRDFCGIQKSTLNQEINELRARHENHILGNIGPYVGIDLIDAIDQVREIGNIGAHMEKDVNKIIPINSEEAEALLRLVELLFAEWYEARAMRQERLTALSKVAAGVAAAKKP